MPLCELWSKMPESKHAVRTRKQKTHLELPAPSADKMVDDWDTDSLVNKISEGVFVRLSASLDVKIEQITKSISAVCVNIKIVEKRVGEAEQTISDTEDTMTQLATRLCNICFDKYYTNKHYY